MQLAYGTLPVVAKSVLDVVPSLTLVAIRIGLTAVVIVGMRSFRGGMKLDDPWDHVRLALLSIAGVSLNQILFIGGIAYTKASNASLLVVTIPIFTLAISVLLGIEKATWAKLLGMLLAAMGVIVLVDPRNAQFGSETTLGDLMIIASSLAFGLYVATSKDVVKRNGALKFMAWVFIYAAVVAVPLGIYSATGSGLSSMSGTVWLEVIYIGLIATALPYLLNAWAIVRVEPTTLAAFIYLQPIIGAIAAAVVLGERLDLKFGIAAMLIFLGLYLVLFRGGLRGRSSADLSKTDKYG